MNTGQNSQQETRATANPNLTIELPPEAVRGESMRALEAWTATLASPYREDISERLRNYAAGQGRSPTMTGSEQQHGSGLRSEHSTR